ncbi:MAG: DUF1704 domain-containing protein [Ignavibacteriales bacterium]|nr:DUF1704 domain-containing protein [Ignavibacteriales bacterium]
MNNYHPEIVLIDNKLLKILSNLDFSSLLTPVNILEEREKFFSNKYYNPLFKYNIKANFDAINNELNSINIFKIQRILGENFALLYEQCAKEIKKKIKLVSNIGNSEEFSEKSIELYGLPTIEVLKYANEEIAKINLGDYNENTISVDVDNIKELIFKEMRKYEKIFKGKFKEYWRITVYPTVVSMSINDIKREIIINSNTKFPPNYDKIIRVHEIGTHILRAENGYLQPSKIFVFGLSNYLKTEEGLAVINESNTNASDLISSFRYNIWIIAIKKALESSFRELFSFLTEEYNIPQFEAWRIACRVKRGLENTSEKGAYTKDHIYISGKFNLDSFIRSGGDINKLYVGKIGLQQINIIETMLELNQIFPAKYLPVFKNVN